MHQAQLREHKCMSLEPTIKCTDIKRSLAFYVDVLDFSVVLAPDTDPESFMSRYAYLQRQGDGMHLSSHAGDGVFGNVVYVRVDNVDALFKQFVERGLQTMDTENFPALTIPLTDQTWGMREFSVRDPDGNKLTFGQPSEGA